MYIYLYIFIYIYVYIHIYIYSESNETEVMRLKSEIPVCNGKQPLTCLPAKMAATDGSLETPVL